MGKAYRSERLAGEVKRITGQMLLTGIKDPRITNAMVCVTDAEVTSDGSYATIYVTATAVVDHDEVLAGLRSASGVLRKEIGRQVKIRRVPELVFRIDSSMEYGRHIDSILEELDIKPENPEEDS